MAAEHLQSSRSPPERSQTARTAAVWRDLPGLQVAGVRPEHAGYTLQVEADERVMDQRITRGLVSAQRRTFSSTPFSGAADMDGSPPQPAF